MAAVFQRLRAVADVVGLGLHRCALRFRCCVDHHLGISLCRWDTATRMKSAAGVTLYLAMGKFDELWIWHPGDHQNIQLVNDGKWTIAKSFLEKTSHIPYLIHPHVSKSNVHPNVVPLRGLGLVFALRWCLPCWPVPFFLVC